MLQTIQDTLALIEQEHHIRILYAVESGSRAWGFASPDSDYDVRYIYIRTVEDYLRIDSLRDTIEGPLDDILDFSGWDLKKALELLRKTNPSLMEWVQSPIVYRTSPEWEILARYVSDYFSQQANLSHYFSMAHGNWQKHMRTEQIRLKGYLYVLRPLLCCLWLERYGTVPPVPYDQLCEGALPAELKPVMADLLRRKLAADESEQTDHIPELTGFIEQEIPRLKQVLRGMPAADLPGFDALNRIFREILHQAWQ